MVIETARALFFGGVSEEHVLSKYMTVKFWYYKTLQEFKNYTQAVEDMCAFLSAKPSEEYLTRKAAIEQVLGWHEEEAAGDVKT